MPAYTDPLPFKVGDILTNYSGIEVEVSAIASGGFGLVAFGQDRLAGKMRALKTMKPAVLRRGPQIRDLFIREGLTWVGVWPHANVVTAQYVTNLFGLPFLVLDYAEQGSLRRHIRPGLSLAQAFTWVQHIAAGMVHLHTPDPDHLRPDPIIHRDLKPDNILIDKYDFACVTDFGLAKTQAAMAQIEGIDDVDEEEETAQDNTRSQRYHTQRGSAMGTPAYMAPEQWVDASIAGPAADVYAFGLIMGELLTGQHPLLSLDQRHSQQEWLAAHVADQHRPLPSVFPIPLQRLYDSLLSLDPSQRPTMADIFTQLQTTARRLSLPAYEVPLTVQATTQNQLAFWHSWSNAYDWFDLYEEALVRSDRAYALAPQHPAVLSSRADILAHLGRTEEALAMYAASLAARPSDDHQGRNIVLNQQGILFRRVQRYAEAEATYASALLEMPGAGDTWYNRAVNALSWGRQELQKGNAGEVRRLGQVGLTYLQHAQDLKYDNPQMADLKADLRRLAGQG